MNITGKTKITGLFGYPVEHTLSPAMHNAAFEYLGMDYCYVPFLVHPNFIGEAVGAVRTLNMVGVNITVPHKESVISLLDSIDDEAMFIGAVNTIVHHEDRLAGYNTDGRGFVRSLAENHISVAGKKILVIGAGGASKAISYYLSEKAGKLYLYDVDKNKLEKLVSDLTKIRSNVSALDQLARLDDFEIIINATPLGLRNEDPLPLDVSGLIPEQTVCDLIYRVTPLLEKAALRGCRTLDGLGMLLWQGALAFELWTAVSPPVEVMKKALLMAVR
jgi:shikimate dehydrogenase